jgi:hypothetical protein
MGAALLSPWGLIWSAAAVAIVGLYLLRPRARRMEVSSAWLWTGVLKEESARSPIQWLKRHLLALLQVLIALVAMLLLARPALTQQSPVGHTVVLAIDASEPMLASDGDPAIAGRAGGTASRLDEAKGLALQFLSRLRPGDRAIVMAAADRVEIAAQGTLPGDLRALQQGIQRIQVRATELDVEHAVQVAAGLTQTARLGELVLITGGVADAEQVPSREAVNIQVARVGRGQPDNQAVTALSARRDRNGDVEVFTRVRNFSDQPASGALRFTVDGELYHEVQVTIPAQQSWESVLTEFPEQVSVVQASFGRTDLLALDNVAVTAVAAPLTRKVLLVGGRSDQLERALRAIPGVELTKGDAQSYSATGGYDVYVFEGWFPATPPPGHWLLIDPPVRGAPVMVTGTLGRHTEGGREINDAQIARVLPSPVLNGVDLTGVGITEAKKVRLPEWAEEAVGARDAPLIFTGYYRPYRAALFAFDLRSTNLFGRIGFPILIANTLNWLTGDTSGTARNGPFAEFEIVPGDALMIHPLPRASGLQIETPAKQQYRFAGNQPVRFLDTGRPGAYTVIQFDGTTEIARQVYVATVLPQGREAALADLRPRSSIEDLATVGGRQPQPLLLGPGFERTFFELWRPLGVLILLGLVGEWWWYHR